MSDASPEPLTLAQVAEQLSRELVRGYHLECFEHDSHKVMLHVSGQELILSALQGVESPLRRRIEELEKETERLRGLIGGTVVPPIAAGRLRELEKENQALRESNGPKDVFLLTCLLARI